MAIIYSRSGRARVDVHPSYLHKRYRRPARLGEALIARKQERHAEAVRAMHRVADAPPYWSDDEVTHAVSVIFGLAPTEPQFVPVVEVEDGPCDGRHGRFWCADCAHVLRSEWEAASCAS